MVKQLNLENKEFNEPKDKIEKFFQNKDINILLKQIIDFDLKDFDLSNYLFSITNKLSLKKRPKEKEKFFSFSLNLLDTLFYLDLRFLQNLKLQNLNKKIDSKLLKLQSQPVLMILFFKDKDNFEFKKGLEKNEILLKNDWPLIKNNCLIIDNSLSFLKFLSFLNKVNSTQKIIDSKKMEKLEFFLNQWREIEQLNKKLYLK